MAPGMSDCSKDILDAVARAYADKTPLFIRAGGTKQNIIGRSISGTVLDLSEHSGVIDYQPSELVITARAGTPVSDLITLLAKERQMLAFEPPVFNDKATLGGTLASGLSGPARPWAGSIRDMVLGVQLINGKAELLNFGGQVMKNVAGYDVSRLQAGALGTLGVLSQVSLKVLPQPEHTLTLALEFDAQSALEAMNKKSATAKPLSGAFWVDGTLFLRLSGAEAAVSHTAKLWGGEQLTEASSLWQSLCEMSHPFFAGDAPLWRLSHKSTAKVELGFGDTLIDWGGAQRWLRGEHDRTELEQCAAQAGGHLSLFKGGDRQGEVKQRMNSIEQRLHQRLKQSFDPEGILNPGRLYSWM